MVHHNIVCIHSTETVAFMIGHIYIPETETDVTDNCIFGTDFERIIGYADTVAWSRLSCNRDIGVLESQCRFEMNGTVNVKDNNTGSALLAGPAERAFRTVVFKRSDMQNFASPPACNITAETFCARECRNPRFGLKRHQSCQKEQEC